MISRRLVFERHIGTLPFLDIVFVVTNTYLVDEFYTLHYFFLLNSFTNCYAIFRYYFFLKSNLSSFAMIVILSLMKYHYIFALLGLSSFPAIYLI